MSKDDITVSPFAGVASEIKPSVLKPIFLVIIEEGGQKKSLKNFLALKIEKHDAYVEFKGQEVSDYDSNLNDPHSVFEAAKTVELTVPWHRICQIKNLSFKPIKS